MKTVLERQRIVNSLKNRLCLTPFEETMLRDILHRAYPVVPVMISEQTWACPVCDAEFENSDSDDFNFCPICGQAFDFEEYWANYREEYD